MKNLIIISVLLLAGLNGFGQNERLEYIKKTANGVTLPDFEILRANGDTTSFYQIKAKLIVIDIWATWCSPCKAQAPFYEMLRTKFEGKLVAFISISIDETPKKWMKYLKKKKKNKWHYWAGKDENHPIEQLTYYSFENKEGKFTAHGIPRYILIDKDYKIIQRTLPIPNEGLKERIEKELLKLK